MKKEVKKIGGLGCLRRKRDLTIVAKEGMLEGLVAPTTLYGSEIWMLNTGERRVEVFDMKCLRSVLGMHILGRVRNSATKRKIRGR